MNATIVIALTEIPSGTCLVFCFFFFPHGFWLLQSKHNVVETT